MENNTCEKALSWELFSRVDFIRENIFYICAIYANIFADIAIMNIL